MVIRGGTKSLPEWRWSSEDNDFNRAMSLRSLSPLRYNIVSVIISRIIITPNATKSSNTVDSLNRRCSGIVSPFWSLDLLATSAPSNSSESTQDSKSLLSDVQLGDSIGKTRSSKSEISASSGIHNEFTGRWFEEPNHLTEPMMEAFWEP